jgi:hypothetical protein
VRPWIERSSPVGLHDRKREEYIEAGDIFQVVLRSAAAAAQWIPSITGSCGDQPEPYLFFLRRAGAPVGSRGDPVA